MDGRPRMNRAWTGTETVSLPSLLLRVCMFLLSNWRGGFSGDISFYFLS